MKKLRLLPAPADDEAGSRDHMIAMTAMQSADMNSTESSMCADFAFRQLLLHSARDELAVSPGRMAMSLCGDVQ